MFFHYHPVLNKKLYKQENNPFFLKWAIYIYYTMKYIILGIFVLVFCATSVNAQKVYKTSYKSDADKIIFVTDYKSEADMIVYETKYKSEAKPYSGIWFWTTYKSEADWQVYFTKYKSEANLKIYITKYKSEAGMK